HWLVLFAIDASRSRKTAEARSSARALLRPTSVMDAITAASGRQAFPLSCERPFLPAVHQDGGCAERHDRNCANFFALATSPWPRTPLFTCGPQAACLSSRPDKTNRIIQTYNNSHEQQSGEVSHIAAHQAGELAGDGKA